MLRVSIIELDYHPEVLRNFCDLMANQEVEFDIYCTEAIWSKVISSSFNLAVNFRLNLCGINENRVKFIEKHLAQINQTDLLMFNTLAHGYKDYNQLDFKLPIALRIHNANSYLGSNFKYRPIWTFFQIKKDLFHFLDKTVLQSDYRHRRAFLKKVDYFLFPNQEIKNFAVRNYKLDAASTGVLPFAFHDPTKNYHSTEPSRKVIITVVGKVDPRTRDYYELVKEMKQLNSVKSAPYKLILLGKSDSDYGAEIVGDLKRLESDQFEFLSFKKFIDQDTFEYYIRATDFFLIPIMEKARYTIYNEWYGKTKITGSLNDILKYSKPALIPHHYPLSKELKAITNQYKKGQLSEKLWDWINNKDYLELDPKPMREKFGKKQQAQLAISLFKKLSGKK